MLQNFLILSLCIPNYQEVAKKEKQNVIHSMGLTSINASKYAVNSLRGISFHAWAFRCIELIYDVQNLNPIFPDNFIPQRQLSYY